MSDEAKIDRALSNADDECESANYHNWIGLAGEIYDAVQALVPKPLRATLAGKIAKAIVAKI